MATMAIRPENRSCLANLGAVRASFTPLPDQYYGAGCSAINAVRLASLRSDSAALALTNLGPVTCPLAETFAGWARFGVDRAAQQILGSTLVRIETMGSYNCRNVAGTDRRSAHATANAIDVSGFALADGRRSPGHATAPPAILQSPDARSPLARCRSTLGSSPTNTPCV